MLKDISNLIQNGLSPCFEEIFAVSNVYSCSQFEIKIQTHNITVKF